MKKWSLRAQFTGLVLLTLAGFGTFAVLAFDTLREVEVNGPVYEDIAQGKDLIADIEPPPAFLEESYLTALQMIDEKEPGRLEALIAKCVRQRRKYEARLGFWTRTLPAGAVKSAMIQESQAPALEYL